MTKILVTIGISIVVIYVVVFLVAILVQQFLIYPVPRDKNQDCTKKIADETIIRNNTTLYYQDNNSDTIVIFYHGNADIVCDKVGLVDIFNERDVSYIFVEYPGYSGNSGEASHEGLRESVHETISFINEMEYEHVYVIGQSIGTGAASYHTSAQAPERLLLLSPFTTLTDVVVKMFPIYPRSLIEKVFDNQFDNTDLLKNYIGKLLIVHGTKDIVVPEYQGRQLFESVPSQEKKYIEAQGYRHANVYDSQEFRDAVKSIIE